MSLDLAKIKLSVNIVSWNNEETICAALGSILEQSGFKNGENLRINLLDNASSDSTLSRVKEAYPRQINLIESTTNLGFSKAHNQLISQELEASDFIVVMNPDLALRSDTLEQLVRAICSNPRTGTACPKLLRADGTLKPLEPAVIDAAGMYITPNCRHFDRGSGELDRGQYDEGAYVFGGSGALLILRKEFIQDAKLEGEELELFDNDFFAYREDADLAWRAQLKGWHCKYCPQAVAYHVRKVTPERRAALSASINRFGVRNRFYLQLHNFSFTELKHCIIPTAVRNLMVLGAVFTVEPTSLPALADLYRSLKTSIAKRKNLLKNPTAKIAKWFQSTPYVETLMKSDKPIRSVDAIVINYNSGFALEKTLQTLTESAKAISDDYRVKVVVFDNASADASAARLDATYREQPNVEIVISADNLGFAGAINKVAKESHADGLLILNPDVNVSKDCLRGLVETLNRHPEFAICAPVLCDEDNKPQLGFTARKLPSLGSSVAELLGFHKLFPDNRWTKEYLMQTDNSLENAISQSESIFEVQQPAGACLLVRKEVFDSLQGFDSQFHPAWFEDVDFCKRCLEQGWKIGLSTSQSALHSGGSSLEHIGDKGFIRAFFPNYYRYWMKHGSLLEKVLFNVAFRAGMLIRTLAEIPAIFIDRESLAKHFFAVAIAPNATEACVEQLRKLSALIHGPIAALRHVKRALLGANQTTNLNEGISVPRQGSATISGDNGKTSDSSKSAELSLDGEGLCLSIESAATRNPNNKVGQDELEATAMLSLSQEEIEMLNGVSEGSLDYLIAPKILERIDNPLGALKNWCSKIKPGGTIYLTVEDKTQTDNSVRAHTTLEHLILDYLEPCKTRTFEHYLDRSTQVEQRQGTEAIRFAKTLSKEKAPIVLHPMTATELTEAVDWFSKNVQPVVRLEGPTRDLTSSEIHMTLRVGGLLQ